MCNGSYRIKKMCVPGYMQTDKRQNLHAQSSSLSSTSHPVYQTHVLQRRLHADKHAMCRDSRMCSGNRQANRSRQGNLLTVLDPCGRVQPDTDLLEPWRLEGSRLTLGERETQWGEREKEREEMQKSQKDWMIERANATERKKGNREIRAKWEKLGKVHICMLGKERK